MSKKTEKALRQLDIALQEAAPEADPVEVYEKELMRKSKYKIYNADTTDADPEDYSQALLKPRKKFSLWPLLLLGFLAAIWYLWQQGVIPW